MNQAGAWSLVTESGADGLALGPVVPAPACLDCVRRRRQASRIGTGSFGLRVLTDADCLALRATRLFSHQVHPLAGAGRFIALPDCPAHCPLRPAPPSLAVEDCVGSRLGLVQGVDLVQVLPGWHTAIALGARPIGSAGVPVMCSGTATAADPTLARRLALYEALERYAAAYWPAGALVDAGGDEEPLVAMRLGEGEMQVPAARVFMPIADRQGRMQGNSTGLACGSSAGDALERAAAEVVEREVLDAWLALPPAAASRVPAAGNCRQVIGEIGMHAVVVSVAWSPDAPYASAGIGCARSIAQAGDKAERERMHVAAHQLLARQGYWGRAQTPASPLDRLLLGMADDAGMARDFVARVASSHVVRAPARPMAWRDITPPDVAAFGLAVVRALHIDA